VIRQIVLATHNAHKLHELQRILAGPGHPYDVIGIDDLPDPSVVPDVKETGSTFQENALLKAHAIAEATGLAAVADDSGLVVDALNGMPGILSARWSGRHGDDRGNLDLLLAQLSDVPDDRRGAAFQCAAAIALPDGRERVVVGVMIGRLRRTPLGDNGFGYDPIFVPEGYTRTSAELSPEAKDAISHRGHALRALVPVLSELLG
jgi:XTP/dITP diphosphohydrolase